MTNSMTAFARREMQLNGIDYCWEIKAVNHRYQDVSFRLPENYRHLESALRGFLRDQLSRGKLECQLKQQNALSSMGRVVINEQLVETLVSTAQRLSSEQLLANDLTVSHLFQIPGLLQFLPEEFDNLESAILDLFQQAIKQLQQMRAEEGRALAKYIEQRLEALEEEISRATSLSTNDLLVSREKFIARLHSIKIDADETRIAQEVALLLTKMDVTEELDRLTLHLQEVRKVLYASEPVGRRLDFLMQELNREANTLSSKSNSAALTQCAVEMKVLIEQMREQIQNIE